MHRRPRPVGIVSMAGLVLAMTLAALPVAATVEMLDLSKNNVEGRTIEAVLAMFRHADEAIRDRNLDQVTALYSDQYNYHGLRKSDIRAVWANLFDEYQEISSHHLFSRIAKVGAGSDTMIEVTCTGHLWAISKTSGLRVPIDSWHEEIHYLVFEKGAWRIRGNAGESPRVMPFGTAPHPLF